MSNIYHTEPPTQGKVLIRTSYGDIDIELWAKEAPLACRNFIQLALEGYYDNTLVHRVIKGFMVQMGDSSGTGTGGTSIYDDKPFKDEVHGRIKFNHRGQVAMASDRPNNNLSQFFITLDKCDWLNGKHTIFGKVTGNTIYNVLRMGEAEVATDDRPADSIRIIGVDVLWNPFEDIVPRAVTAASAAPEAAAPPRRETKAQAVRDKKLLSFANDAESSSEGEEMVAVKFRSAHEARAQAAGKTVKPAVTTTYPPNGPSSASATNSSLPSKAEQRNVSSVQDSHKLRPRTAAIVGNEAEEDDEDTPTNADAMLEQLHHAQRSEGAAQRVAEFQEARAALLKTRHAVSVLTGSAAEQRREEVARTNLLTPLEQRRQQYKKRKHEHGDRAEETFQKLQAFTESLRRRKAATTESSAANGAATGESYRGQVLYDDAADEEVADDWCAGKLRFAKHMDDSYRYKDTRGAAEE